MASYLSHVHSRPLVTSKDCSEPVVWAESAAASCQRKSAFVLLLQYRRLPHSARTIKFILLTLCTNTLYLHVPLIPVSYDGRGNVLSPSAAHSTSRPQAHPDPRPNPRFAFHFDRELLTQRKA